MMIPKFVGGVPVDVIVRESHQADSTIAMHPVERGAHVSDHITIEPKRLFIEGAAQSGAATWQALLAARATRMPFTIVTGFDVYQNMVIEKLDAERDARFSTTLRFTAALREVIIVDTETTDGSPSGTSQSDLSSERLAPGSVRDRGASVVQRGNQAAAPVSASDLSQARNLLSAVLG
jgi:hypothetical protein